MLFHSTVTEVFLFVFICNQIMIVVYDSIINDIDCYKYFCSNKGACDILLMNHLMHL